MNDLEDRITQVLDRGASSVEVRPDLASVLAGGRTLRAPSHHRTRSPLVAASAAAVAAVAVLAVAALAVTRDDGQQDLNTAQGPLPSPVESTSVAARYVPEADGWSVYDVSEYEPDQGQANYTRDGMSPIKGRSLQLVWYPADHYDQFVDDRARNDVYDSGTATIGGTEALLFTADPVPGTDVKGVQRLIWPDGPVFFELTGNGFDSVDDFLAVTSTFRKADEASFLAALPARVLQPAEAERYMRASLDQTPLPDAIEPAQLVDEAPLLRLERDLDATLVRAVTCAWIDEWVGATNAGDAARAQNASAALKNASAWPMYSAAPAGSDAVQQLLADAMTAQRPMPGTGEADPGQSYLVSAECGTAN